MSGPAHAPARGGRGACRGGDVTTTRPRTPRQHAQRAMVAASLAVDCVRRRSVTIACDGTPRPTSAVRVRASLSGSATPAPPGAISPTAAARASRPRAARLRSDTAPRPRARGRAGTREHDDRVGRRRQRIGDDEEAARRGQQQSSAAAIVSRPRAPSASAVPTGRLPRLQGLTAAAHRGWWTHANDPDRDGRDRCGGARHDVDALSTSRSDGPAGKPRRRRTARRAASTPSAAWRAWRSSRATASARSSTRARSISDGTSS